MIRWVDSLFDARARRMAGAFVLMLAFGLFAAPIGFAQSQPESATRAPAAPAPVPEPEVVEVMMGAWEAEIPDDSGRVTDWRLELEPDGAFTIEVRGPASETERRTGTYEIDTQSVRLFFPPSADERDPNSTALNLADARSLETYFYRLLGEDRLAFRPTMCRVDPCQWIAERAE